MVVTMQLIVGLGNPGPKYLDTRHNVGFRIADVAAQRARLRLSTAPKGSKWTAWLKRQDLAEAGQGSYQGRAFTLIKPLTFMNHSGEAVRHKALDRRNNAVFESLLKIGWIAAVNTHDRHRPRWFLIANAV
jgi:PTH1 family peptidyl-tRNA hydrolase